MRSRVGTWSMHPQTFAARAFAGEAGGFEEDRNRCETDSSRGGSLLRGRQLGDGMGGGRNGRFWGAPILHLSVEKCCIFQGFGQKSGRPKNLAVPTTTDPIPQLTPSELLGIFKFGPLSPFRHQL